MATIINNTDFTFSTQSQNVINNAAATLGVDTVYTSHRKNDSDNIFDMYANDEYSEYLFSVDTDADGKTIIWDRA